jgi:hypothetical protein
MFGRRKSEKANLPGNDWKDKAAGKIAGIAFKLQTKFAFFMNRLVSNIPPKRLKLLLIVFCFLSGGFSAYLAAHAIFAHTPKEPAINLNPIHMPRHYDRTGSEINEPENRISDELYQEIQAYKKAMDSLGEPIRPGLLDSIVILENIYLSQQTK